ncbi:MAG: ATPase domain-containing protein [Novosphingobium sp.]
MVAQDEASSASTGIAGLDDVLAGGFERGRLFLIEGSPGTGKTTIATQFLIEGAKEGERVLYITLSETEDELRASAESHGWKLDGVDIHELLPPENLLNEEQQQSLLYSSDLELGETTRRIFDVFDRVQPSRVVLDSLSEIRLLAQSSLRYRRQVLALKHYFAQRRVTVLFLDDLTTGADDNTVQSISHGVIRLEELAAAYGPDRRRLRILKYRGRRYRGGFHDFKIKTGGVRLFPRLVSAEHKRGFNRDVLKSHSPELNALLGGGIERGSSVLLLGAAGTGKSLLTLTFLANAVERGERAAMFLFEEEKALLIDRTRQVGIDLGPMIDSGAIVMMQVDAAELTPGEFSERVRHCVQEHGARTIIVDSLNGYLAAMPGESAPVLHIHELLQYLNRQGATTFLTVAQHGLVGTMKSPVDATYLADTVILLRYFEAKGRVRRAISVVKKRMGAHEDTIREYRIDHRGIVLGEPLMGFQGVLSGVPVLVGEDVELLGPARE